MIRFLLVFGLLSAVSHWQPFIENVREPYCELLAHSLYLFFSLTSLDPVLMGASVAVGFGRSLEVVISCDGLILLTLFIAGVAAMPIQRTPRPYVWAGGALALLVVINWLRLLILALIAFYHPDLFEVMHLYVVQGALMFAVLILLFAWFSYVDPGRTVLEAPETLGT